ncbi:hypothetical protein HY637_03685 [Candidatus Woesearchaeota archaeon]|nr:hypothetical protein [Candidatus Woesearchaeota archaeon]
MEQKIDDDIDIDFSKIKNFFKKKAKSDSTEYREKQNPETKDDEITIDFSKIRSLFKADGVPKEKKVTQEQIIKKHEAHHVESDDNLSFNFEKIKNFFKAESSDSDSDDAFPVNWGKVRQFFKKYGIILIALIPIILSIYVRMQAAYLPVVDEWATNAVINSIRSQIRNDVNQKFPNLPDANKNDIAEKELQNFISGNKAQINQQIEATSKYFMSFFLDENGKNYMPDIDPYYWYRYAKNVLKNGHPGDELRDGRPFDNHQLAPNGRFVVPDMFNAYFLAYFYKLVSIVIPSITLMRSTMYVPVIISAIDVLLVFLIARKIGGNMSAFFASLMFAVNSAFLGRTLFGHSDTDMWVVFWSLFITWIFVLIVENKKMLGVAALSIFGGLSIGFFAFSWGGWWFIFDFIVISFLVTLAYLPLVHLDNVRKSPKEFFLRTDFKMIFIALLIFVLSSILFTTLFQDFNTFRESVIGPFTFRAIKTPVRSELTPNVLTTVAELNEGSINSIINSVGGRFFFFLSWLGLLLSVLRKDGYKKFDIFYIIVSGIFYASYFLLTRWGVNIGINGLIIWISLPIIVLFLIMIYKRNTSYDFKLGLLLLLWVVSSVYASIKGIRFTLLLAPPFSVAFGVVLGMFFSHCLLWLTKELKIYKIIGASMLFMLILLLYVNPIKGAIHTAGQDIPIINDAWYNTLISIKDNSKENAIITSWWDFGHHFKAIADRPVTFDGTTQAYVPSHWVGRLFMTDNEQEAIGIMRILDCSNGEAYTKLKEYGMDIHKSIKIIREIMLLDTGKARSVLLEYGLSSSQAEEVLKMSHCNPPEGFVIASEDMIGKSGVWSHFGSWSFERADLWYNARGLPQDKAVEYMISKFNYTKDRAENVYDEMLSISSDSEANSWIAPWPGYGGQMTCRKNEEGLYVCQPLGIGNNVALVFNINTSNYDIYAVFQGKTFRPGSAAFVTENGLYKKTFSDAATGHGMTVIPINKEEVQVVVSSNELTGSMFTRMFYMQGHGLRYFKLVNHQRGLTGTDIYTYKVDWEGKNTTIVTEYAYILKEPSEKVVLIENSTSIP